ncbi:MAG: polysaccharide deacetylase family protein [Tannerellaceae bacterium]|nr:polysaccharide deacetylase family protein [Tannerellaceae bacterium]
MEEINGVPILYGTAKTEWYGTTKVIDADLIASTYFLITRYEEMIKRTTRDEHGRFPGKQSFLYQAGLLGRPLADEYRLLVRTWLQECLIPIHPVTPGIRKIYLTHDVDMPFLYRSWKGMVRSVIKRRGILTTLKGKFGALKNDPYYTFPWLFSVNKQLEEKCKKTVESIFFFKAGGNTPYDKPHYRPKDRAIAKLLKNCAVQQASIGLHASYEAGMNPLIIKEERKRLEEQLQENVYYNRNHYLMNREPEDMDILETAGITHDFTMGYADIAGFRLGTSRPVRWINPVTRRVSSLKLQPLVIMDCSLEEKRYMALNYKEAREYTSKLIHRIHQTGGEIVLLWHNTSVVENTDSYLRTLYIDILNELAEI